MSHSEELKALADRHVARVEKSVVAGMYEAAFKASGPFETFSLWQLVLSGAIASFLVANADRMTELLSKPGFLVCSGFLVASAIFGLYSKSQAVMFKVLQETRTAIPAAMDAAFREHEEHEENLHRIAKEIGCNISTEIRMDEVQRLFLQPLPRWSRWLSSMTISSQSGGSHSDYIGQIRCLHSQLVSAYLQSVLLLTFFGAALAFSGASI